jgi:hypothetical protein
MQPTPRLHDGVANAVRQETDLVFHHPVSFSPTNRVFDTDSDGRDQALRGFLRGGEFTPPWLFLRLDARDIVTHKALQSPLLIEVTPAWEGLTGQRRAAFLMFLACHGGTQEADVTGLLDDEQIFAWVTRLLAAVGVLLVLWIDGAMDRSLSAFMPQRGGLGTPAVRVAASITANSSAWRAGRRSWWANA